MDIEFRKEVRGKGITDPSTEDVGVKRALRERDPVKLVSRFQTKTSSESEIEPDVKASAGAVVKVSNIKPHTPIEDVAFSIEHQAIVIVGVLALRNDNPFSNFKVFREVLKVSVDSDTPPPICFQFKPCAPDKRARL